MPCGVRSCPSASEAPVHVRREPIPACRWAQADRQLHESEVQSRKSHFCFRVSGVSTSVPLGTHQGAISHEQLDFYLDESPSASTVAATPPRAALLPAAGGRRGHRSPPHRALATKSAA